MLTRKQFWTQRGSAKFRGIDFQLTFEQWKDWWEASGHADERGKGVDRYVMARIGDTGPYDLGNIKCITHAENLYEYRSGRGMKVGTGRAARAARRQLINNCAI